MKAFVLWGAAILLLASADVTFADSRAVAFPNSQSAQEKEVLVFVTGSLIPHRVKLQRIGSKTTSPLRVIDRNEIDQNGRPTTPAAFINDPSVRIIGR